MTFTGTGVGLASIIAFISESIYDVFTAIDSVQFSDIPFSLLDVFLLIMFTELIFDWITTFIHTHTTENEEPSYSISSEVGINATEEEIDFSGEIVHE